MLSTDEITRRAIQLGATDTDTIASKPIDRPDPIGALPTAADSYRPLGNPPHFKVRDSVMTVAEGFVGHTRLPAYARGKQGVVTSHHQGWVFPDSNAHGQGEQPQHLYTVRFSSEELWQRRGFSVSLDLFESYFVSEQL